MGNTGVVPPLATIADKEGHRAGSMPGMAMVWGSGGLEECFVAADPSGAAVISRTEQCSGKVDCGE
jgi:hypothetical protein